MRIRSENSKYVRRGLILLSSLTIIFLIVIPILFVFIQAFSKGVKVYWESITDPSIIYSLKLTLFATTISVILNLIFGLSIAWALGKFKVPGKRLIIGLIELPLSISPVIAGLTFILFLGKFSLVGSWLNQHGIIIIFAVPGVVIATLFVTLPYIAREIIPLIQETGNDEEEAALLLGAGGLRTFFYVTLPNIKWGVIYGILITTARAMGEFGAVSVISGHLRGKTDTLTLQVEMLYDEYNFNQSFAVASILTLLAIVTLVIKTWTERKRSASE
jgi:sulfate transport system permease protein